MAERSLREAAQRFSDLLDDGWGWEHYIDCRCKGCVAKKELVDALAAENERLDYGPLVTADEAEAMLATCRFTQAAYRMIDAGDDGTITAAEDRAEIVAKIHGLQQWVMANVAARAVQPIRFRTVGGKCFGKFDDGTEPVDMSENVAYAADEKEGPQ
jgi:hypothetical protein